MGNRESTAPVVEQLNNLDIKAKYLKEWIDRQKRKKQRFLTVIISMGVLLIVLLLVVYGIYMPGTEDWALKILYFFLILVCIIPISFRIVVCVKIVQCSYDGSIDRKRRKLNAMMSKTDGILQTVKEKTPYNDAQMILNRFEAGPSHQKPTINMNMARR